MSALLRDCSPALATALANGTANWSADLFDFTLADGTTIYNWTTWDSDLTVGATAYSSRKPWLTRSNWNVSNTMEVPSLTIYLRALNDSFAGGAQIKKQIHNGLFDGASFLLSRAYMTSPGDTTTLGTIELFGGKVGAIDLYDTTAIISGKAKTYDLDKNFPRNIVQIGCNHAFCDPGCTLSRATFTAPYVVGSTPTTIFLPWPGAPPANATNYQLGTVVMTSGANSGARRTVAKAGSTGLTLVYPLYALPAAGDSFTAFEGCDKFFSSSSGQDCTARSNTQHWRGFDHVPPPNSAY